MCISPIPVKVYRKNETLIERELQRNPRNNHSYIYAGKVPCGKCYECLSYIRLQYQFRMEQEATDSVASFFITFTYADEYLPPEGVSKEYCKKMIRYLKNDVKLKFTYYMIGEYGTSPQGTHRPHYHALFFLKEKYDDEYFCRVVNNAHSIRENVNGVYQYTPQGFVTISQITPARIGYITHYHTRPKTPPTNEYKNKTFQILSKGLGTSLFNDEKIVDYISKKSDYLVYNMQGKSVPLPYYYRRKYGIYKDIKQRKDDVLKDSDVNYYKNLTFRRRLQYLESIRMKDKEKLNKYFNQVKLNYL